MLGILLILAIGNYFYKLAQKFNQNKWLYAILGIVSYYFGAIVVGGIILGIFIELVLSSSIDNYSDLFFSLMALPFGILTTCLFYFLLRKKWKKSVVIVKDEIQDIGKNIDE